MVDLTLELECNRISNTLSVNYAQTIGKMALLFAKINFKIAFSSHLKTYILKSVPDPTMVGLIIDTGY